MLLSLRGRACFVYALSFHFHSSHSSLDTVFAWIVVAVSIESLKNKNLGPTLPCTVYIKHIILSNSYIIQVLFLFYGMKNMYVSSSAVVVTLLLKTHRAAVLFSKSIKAKFFRPLEYKPSVSYQCGFIVQDWALALLTQPSCHPLNLSYTCPHLGLFPFLSILPCLSFRDLGSFSREILPKSVVPVLGSFW